MRPKVDDEPPVGAVSELQRRLDKERAPITNYQGSLSICTRVSQQRAHETAKKTRSEGTVHCAGVSRRCRAPGACSSRGRSSGTRKLQGGAFIESFGKVARSGVQGGALPRTRDRVAGEVLTRP
jgi:hypothetical protein